MVFLDYGLYIERPCYYIGTPFLFNNYYYYKYLSQRLNNITGGVGNGTKPAIQGHRITLQTQRNTIRRAYRRMGRRGLKHMTKDYFRPKKNTYLKNYKQKRDDK